MTYPWMQPTTPWKPKEEPKWWENPTTEVPVETKPISYEQDFLEPFRINPDLPLWAKSLSFIGKPFELIQDYLFNPVLAVAHQPFAQKNLNLQDLKVARQQGVLSYLPGGVRYQSYENLKYPGKWAVEMLPWLIVPPIGAVGVAGRGAGLAGKGIAGALGRAGTVGKIAGRALEYSPAGLAEKATGKVIGGVASKLGKVAPKVIPDVVEQDPLIGKMIGVVKSAQAKLPEQKALTHELRVQQLSKAVPELQKATGEKALVNFMKALKGQGEKADWTAIRGQFTKQEINKLADMIRTSEKLRGFDRAPAISGWKKILDGDKIPFDSELEQLEKVFGKEFIEAILEKRAGNIINKVSDIANAPRAVLSAVDLSGLLRQGAVLTSRHPIEAIKTIKPMLKAFVSDKSAGYVDDIIRLRPNTSLGEQMGLYLAPLPGKAATVLSRKEEAFMSNFVEKIPLIGSVVKASERSYITVLNDLRSRVWESTLSAWQKIGAELTDADYKSLASFINAASGRGSLPKALQGASPLFNAIMFSPRLFISRLQLPATLLTGTPLVRKEAARTLAQFLGAGASILGMAHVAGSKIELDPRSSDFGKIQLGNTRLDIWSGYLQFIRFAAQLYSGQRKTAGGNITELNRREVVDRFFQSKYSPAFGLLNDLLRGESYAGEQFGTEDTLIQRQVYNRIMPLFIQDMIDAIEQEGLVGGMVALPGLFGVGVVTYNSPAQKLREQLSKEQHGMTWEELGRTKGLAAQMELERSSPKLLAYIEQEQEEYNKTISGKSDIRNVYRNQVKSIENEFNRRVNLATQEYRDTGDGYTYKEKLLEIASNRRSQYDVLNRNPQFSDIVAKYNQEPTAADLKKLSPQDWARKEYMRMLYSEDMYDQYGNYRFDAVDGIRVRFTEVFGQGMLDYIETYQDIKNDDMPPEYKMFKEAQKILRPYWEIQTRVEQMFGKRYSESPYGQRMITKLHQQIRMTNPQVEAAFQKFYTQK